VATASAVPPGPPVQPGMRWGRSCGTVTTIAPLGDCKGFQAGTEDGEEAALRIQRRRNALRPQRSLFQGHDAQVERPVAQGIARDRFRGQGDLGFPEGRPSIRTLRHAAASRGIRRYSAHTGLRTSKWPAA